jgi:hypothetical protein
LSKLNEVSLKQHHEDTKHWEIKRSGKYTVKYCNTLMKKLGYPGISFFSTLLWKCIVPSKFEVFYMVVTWQNMYQIFFSKKESN